MIPKAAPFISPSARKLRPSAGKPKKRSGLRNAANIGFGGLSVGVPLMMLMGKMFEGEDPDELAALVAGSREGRSRAALLGAEYGQQGLGESISTLQSLQGLRDAMRGSIEQGKMRDREELLRSRMKELESVRQPAPPPSPFEVMQMLRGASEVDF